MLELFKRVAGSTDTLPEPIYSIAKDWTKRGVTRKDGRPFTPQNLRSMLLRPAFAGLRKHNGMLVPEQWEGWTPIVPRELFDRVQTVLADPSRRTYTGAHIKHVLTMTMRCDVCGGYMAVMARRKNGRKAGLGYQCHPKGHVWVDKEETDRIIIGDLDRFDPDTGERLEPQLGVVLAYLAGPDRHAALRHRPDAGPEEADLRAEIERLNGELDELRAAPKPKTARARIQRTEDMEELETDLAELEAKLSKLLTPAPLAQLLGDEPITDVVRWWKTAGVEKQRAIAALLLTPDLLGEVRIKPSPGRKPLPVAERISLRQQRPLPAG
ncbi:recombinase family protein [Streptomyces caeni]|uniref:Recombinase family protein n=1 Tax=Streptomyces caeni TaxID=2307231 RepID=A0ABW4IHX7_9ACTN